LLLFQANKQNLEIVRAAFWQARVDNVALPPDKILLLKQADRTAVVNALSGLALDLEGNWLPNTHAAANGIEKSAHKSDGTHPITGAQLAEYLAMAAPTHCADGWSYLSRALNAYFLGDAHSAWHFAYYAELRAAQSILSASGCGAFNGWNCVLDYGGKIVTAGKDPTHEIVWQALSALADVSAPASNHIAAATFCLGHSLPDIVQFAYPGVSVGSTSSNWISAWLFDLQTSAKDKGFRNRCSYDPHAVTPHQSDLTSAIETVTSLWQSLEPMPGAMFIELDKHLIRAALEKTARESLELRGTIITDEAVVAELRLAYARIIAFAPAFQVVSEDFIARVNVLHPILDHARNNDTSPNTPRPALARATLLLRIATGATRNLINDAGQANQLAFWLDELAERQGVVENRSMLPVDRSELHLDCAAAAEDLDHRFATGSVNLASLCKHMDVRPHLFSQLERVVQWSFSP
jgi:hypothetical protein